jgi:phosphate acetyltransferase
MADRGQITGGLFDGPLAFDNAIDPEAARIKGISSAVAGARRSWSSPISKPATCSPRTHLPGAGRRGGIVLGARVQSS